MSSWFSAMAPECKSQEARRVNPFVAVSHVAHVVLMYIKVGGYSLKSVASMNLQVLHVVT